MNRILIALLAVSGLSTGCGSGSSPGGPDADAGVAAAELETRGETGPKDTLPPQDLAPEQVTPDADALSDLHPEAVELPDVISDADSGPETPDLPDGPADVADLPPDADTLDVQTPAESVVQAVGPEGGQVAVGDQVSLSVPPGTLPAGTSISIKLYDGPAGLAPLPPIGTWIEISLDPEPTAPLPKAALLTFFQAGPGGPGTIARKVALPVPGTVQSDDGTEMPAETWVPLQWTRSDGEGNPTVALAGFSQYGASSTPPAQCVPSPDKLEPPPAPEGYEYVGTKVIINYQMDPALSTLPPGFPPASPDLLVFVSSQTQMVDGTVTCHIVITHEFVPEGTLDLECIPSAELMDCPPPDQGWGFVGYDLVINGQLAATTVPLDRPEKPEDLSLIKSETTTEDFAVVCDFIMRCLYCAQSCCKKADQTLALMCPEQCASEGGTALPAESCPVCCKTPAGDAVVKPAGECTANGGTKTPDTDCDQTCCRLDADNYLLMPQGACATLAGTPFPKDQCDKTCCVTGGTDMDLTFEPECASNQGSVWPALGCPCPEGHAPTSGGINFFNPGPTFTAYFIPDSKSFLGTYETTCNNGLITQSGTLQYLDGVLSFTPGPGCLESGDGCLPCAACPSGVPVVLSYMGNWWFTSTCGGLSVLFQHGCQVEQGCCKFPSGEYEPHIYGTCESLGAESVSAKYCNQHCCDVAGEWIAMSEGECEVTGGLKTGAASSVCSPACCEVLPALYEISTPHDCQPPMSLAEEYKCLL